MSRYLLLILLNTPLICVAILGAITRYKLKRSTKNQTVLQIILWTLIFTGLVSAKFIYEWLFSHKLTETEPLSLFDVVQITALITLVFIANRQRIKLDSIEQRLHSLHQEISIRLSKK